MGKASPVSWQVWVMVFTLCEHTLQSTLLLHFLNPLLTCLLATLTGLGTLDLTMISLNELVLL